MKKRSLLLIIYVRCNKQMQNSVRQSIENAPEDIFFEIMTKVDNNALLRMFNTSFREVLTEFFKRNEFWCARVQFLSRREVECRIDVDWKRIYYIVLEHEDPYIRALTDIPTLQVISKIYGELSREELDRFQPRIWARIGSTEVLSYLLEHGDLIISTENAILGLMSAARRGLLDLAQYMIEIQGVRTSESVERALFSAVMTGQAEIVRWLIERENVTSMQAERMLTLVARQGSVEVFKMIVALARPDHNEILASLDEAIVRNRLEIVEYILNMTDAPADDLRLGLAVSSSPKIFQLILQRYRGDPYKILELLVMLPGTSRRSLLKSILKSDNIVLKGSDDFRSQYAEKNADILLRDSRIRTENMDAGQVRLALWLITDLMQDNIRGYYLATETTGEEISEEELYRTVLLLNDIYSLLLVHILLKRPTDHQLLDWMIEMENPAFIEAASSIIEERQISERSVPFRSLLLMLLYPEMTLHELIDELREQNENRENILLSAQLAGIFLGETEMRARSKRRSEEYQ